MTEREDLDADHWREHFKRVDFLRQHLPRCPSCDHVQVQIMKRAIPAEWRCRMCKHSFVFEPSP